MRGRAEDRPCASTGRGRPGGPTLTPSSQSITPAKGKALLNSQKRKVMAPSIGPLNFPTRGGCARSGCADERRRRSLQLMARRAAPRAGSVRRHLATDGPRRTPQARRRTTAAYANSRFLGGDRRVVCLPRQARAGRGPWVVRRLGAGTGSNEGTPMLKSFLPIQQM